MCERSEYGMPAGCANQRGTGDSARKNKGPAKFAGPRKFLTSVMSLVFLAFGSVARCVLFQLSNHIARSGGHGDSGFERDIFCVHLFPVDARVGVVIRP